MRRLESPRQEPENYELIPPTQEYDVPSAAPLTDRELLDINFFLLFRRQVHESSLYTRRPSLDLTNPKKLYEQSHINQRFSVRSRATMDPFTAVPTYSHRFHAEERTLPDFTSRPFCDEFFPQELRPTIEGNDLPSGARPRPRGGKKAGLRLSTVTSLRSAEEAFGINGAMDIDSETADGLTKPGQSNLSEVMKAVGDEEVDEEEAEAEGEGAFDEDEDIIYDDSDAGDYDAENYFDTGGDQDDGGGDDDGGGGDVY